MDQEPVSYGDRHPILSSLIVVAALFGASAFMLLVMWL